MISKKDFILINKWAILKSLKNNYQTGKSITVSWSIKKIHGKDYECALRVWNKLEMKTMKKYHDLNLKSDVFFLGDAFLKNKNNSLKNYGLCLSHYLSVPGLSWDAILNVKKSLTWTYFWCWHVFVLWKRYRKQSFLYF